MTADPAPPGADIEAALRGEKPQTEEPLVPAYYGRQDPRDVWQEMWRRLGPPTLAHEQFCRDGLERWEQRLGSENDACRS